MEERGTDRKNGKKSDNDDGAVKNKDTTPPRYEFEAAKFPKGQRTERDKRKISDKGKENADHKIEQQLQDDCGPIETPRHVKRPRTNRGASKPKNDVPKDEVELQVNTGGQPVVAGDDQVAAAAAAGDDQVAAAAAAGDDQVAAAAAGDDQVAAAAAGDDQVAAAAAGDDQVAVDDKVADLQDPDELPAQEEPDETPPSKVGDPDDKESPVSGIAQDVAPPPANVGKKPVEHKVEKVPEPDTSLSLGVSGSRAAPPSNRGGGPSFQSVSQAETFSNGITTSLSLSCSLHYAHNPSCSMTQTSHDQEFSTATQPMCPDTTEMSQGSWQRSIGARGGLPHSGKHHHHDNRRKSASESTPYHHHHHHKGGLRKKKAGSAGLVSVREIVSGPVLLVAQKINNLPENMLEALKANVMDLLECTDRREEVLQLQKLLEARNDLSSDTLQLCHRTQLEILVTLKTGIKAFLFQERPLQSSLLIEVFLNMKCPNIRCQNQLPVDNCECQVCSQKSGFCNACMCVVCSKFDFDANTCRWVGCDYCLHWCHTECGIRKAFIRPGPSIRREGAGSSEMQFHCISCDQASELFGFVKDVFTTCAKEWSKEVLSRELDCVRRMFHGSDDTRGKQLCWKSDLLLKKLEANHDVGEVCSIMLRFFELGGELVQQTDLTEKRAGEARTKSYDSDPAGVMERATLALQTYDRVLEEKRTDAAEIQYERARKKAEIEELESIMRIKQAEAKMFQARADEAAREAEGLQRIVLAKCLKVEEEYNCKKLKLQIEESEHRRRRKFEDLQLLQKGSDNFEIMRNLMVDLQGLLKTMDPAAKRPRPTTDAHRY